MPISNIQLLAITVIVLFTINMTHAADDTILTVYANYYDVNGKQYSIDIDELIDKELGGHFPDMVSFDGSADWERMNEVFIAAQKRKAKIGLMTSPDNRMPPSAPNKSLKTGTPQDGAL